MHCSEIEEIVNNILDEYVKENLVNFKMREKIKIGSYICGPLNDIIFIICRIIKQMIIEENKNIDLLIYEDENNWYFNINSDYNIKDAEFIEQIKKFMVFVNVRPKISEKQITLVLRKVK